MDSFSDVIELLNRIKSEGVIADYAIGGAMAATFWDEALATQDLDVAVTYTNDVSPFDPLRPILERLPEDKFPRKGEHIMIADVPVQFLPSWSPIVDAAIRNAAVLAYDPSDPNTVSLRVITPTYLAAIWQTDTGALTSKRRDRIARFKDAGLLDNELLGELTSPEKKP